LRKPLPVQMERSEPKRHMYILPSEKNLPKKRTI
jgi:hypothetical protein